MKRQILFFIILSCSIAFGQTKCTLPCSKELLTESRKLLLGQENVTETGHNEGAMIRLYLASCGLKAGNPYCAAGQYWCFLSASFMLGLDRGAIPFPCSGLATSYFYYARTHGAKELYKAAIDDLIIWRNGNTKYGHIERVISAGHGGWVQTIGFNTGRIIDGRKYEGVFRMKRNIYSHYGRLRILGLCGFRSEE